MFKRFDQHYFDLLLEMTKRELKIRYKKTYLGFLWTILNPLIQMVVIGVLFSFFIKTPNYFIFLLSGLLPWQFFSTSLTQITASIVNHRNLIHKAPFPREIIPFSIALSNGLLFIISYSLLIIFSFIFFKLSLLTFLCVVIPAIFWLFILTLGISLISSSLNVERRDIQYVTSASITPWFYATPILYNPTELPVHIQKLLELNPFYTPLSLFHSVANQTLSININAVILNGISCLIILFIGLTIFKNKQNYFVDHL